MNNAKIVKDFTQNMSKTSTGLGKQVWSGINRILDTTYQNIEEPVNYRQQAIEDQERLWKREDEIREHIESREDSAYQRAVEDARKAGINPNLMDINPAQSGGGITSASGMDYTMQQEEYDRETQKLIQAIAQAFDMKENEKDRLNDIVKTVLGGGAMYQSAKARNKK